jgi:hypothetical protein
LESKEPEKSGGKWLVDIPSDVKYINTYRVGAKAQLKSDAKRLREEPNKIGLTAVMESLQKEAAGLEAK